MKSPGRWYRCPSCWGSTFPLSWPGGGISTLPFRGPTPVLFLSALISTDRSASVSVCVSWNHAPGGIAFSTYIWNAHFSFLVLVLVWLYVLFVKIRTLELKLKVISHGHRVNQNFCIVVVVIELYKVITVRSNKYNQLFFTQLISSQKVQSYHNAFFQSICSTLGGKWTLFFAKTKLNLILSMNKFIEMFG